MNDDRQVPRIAPDERINVLRDSIDKGLHDLEQVESRLRAEALKRRAARLEPCDRMEKPYGVYPTGASDVDCLPRLRSEPTMLPRERVAAAAQEVAVALKRLDDIAGKLCGDEAVASATAADGGQILWGGTFGAIAADADTIRRMVAEMHARLDQIERAIA